MLDYNRIPENEGQPLQQTVGDSGVLLSTAGEDEIAGTIQNQHLILKVYQEYRPSKFLVHGQSGLA